EIVSTQKAVYHEEALYFNEKEDEEDRIWENTNHLIQEDGEEFYPYTTGIKTGNTAAAGKCLVSSATKDNMDLIAVVLKSTEDDIWDDSTSLLSYGFGNFENHSLINEGEQITTIELEDGASNNVRLNVIAESTLETFINKDDIEQIREEIHWDKTYFQEVSDD